MTHGFPNEHLTIEARTALQAHEELFHLLIALGTASAAQLRVENEENRTRILELKQWLLEGIARLDLRELSQRTLQLADRALHAGQAELAQHLFDALARNRERYSEIMQGEAEVRSRWQADLDELRGALVQIQQRQTAHKAYRRVPELRAPRFLDGRR
ncbi:MAG: hypothetical protein ACYC7E_14820 [Armatimonadota bacterium]